MPDESLDLGDEQRVTKKQGGSGHLVTLLFLLNLLVLGAILYFQIDMFKEQKADTTVKDIVVAEMKKQLGEEGGLAGEAVDERGILLPLEKFTANLAPTDGQRRFIQLTTVLKLTNESSEEEFRARKPQIRDTIISILNTKRPTDLLREEGKNFLKEEIKASVNRFLIDGKVIDVYYVAFRIQ